MQGYFPGLLLSVIAALKEEEHWKLVHARLKQFSWKDRFLRRIPENFWEMPVPPEVIIVSSIPWLRLTGGLIF